MQNIKIKSLYIFNLQIKPSLTLKGWWTNKPANESV